MRRLADGALGEITGGQCYWNQGGLWVVDKREGMSGMEWQCRNWLCFTWLSGDHIVEQHVHNLDILNWALGGPPVKALGMGGREVRKEETCGNIFDHFGIEYEYANGARVMSMCRQINGTSHRVSERIVGTQGVCDPGAGRIVGANTWTFEGEQTNPYVQEHTDLIESIRKGEPLNEGKRIAESTMTAILGRLSAYTGKEISWDWAMKKSQLTLLPEKLEMGDLPVAPVAVPGQTELA